MPLKDTFEVGLLINPGERLFFSKACYPVFFDQRLTGMKRKNNNFSLDLLMALLNSIIGIYYIEAIGFGRGLGVLDLNKNKVEQKFKLLNPNLLSTVQQSAIISLYKVMEKRDVKNILEELEMDDRRDFDIEVLRAYKIDHLYETIKGSLICLSSLTL